MLEYIKCKAVQNGKNCKSTVVDLSKFDRMSTKELQAILEYDLSLGVETLKRRCDFVYSGGDYKTGS